MPVFTAIAAGLSMIGAALGVGTAAAGFASIAGASLGALVVGGAVVGAVIGGVVAAVKGESILKGALMGGLVGAAAGGALGWGVSAVSGVSLGATETAVGAAGTTAMETATIGDSSLMLGTQAGEIAPVSLLGEGGVATGGVAADTTVAGGASFKSGMTALGAGKGAAGAGAGAAGAGAKGGLLAGMTASDKALMLSTGMSAASGLFGPDEEAMQEKALEAKRKEFTSTEKVTGTVNWDKYDINEWFSRVTPEMYSQTANQPYADVASWRKKPGLTETPAPKAGAPSAAAPSAAAPKAGAPKAGAPPAGAPQGGK